MSEPPSLTGAKRAWEPGGPPEGPPPPGGQWEGGNPPPHSPPSLPLPSSDVQPNPTANPSSSSPPAVSAAVADHAAATEEVALQGEIGWLRQQNAQLQQQLAALQQQHMSLMAAHQHAMRSGSVVGQAQPAPVVQAASPAVVASTASPAAHNPAWSEQINQENGQKYYWNYLTSESTYTKPPDYNPPAGGAAAGGGMPNVKGPPGANLFVVRKMRRGEYDEFTDEDLRREFSKYGTVTRAEMTVDKESGWSKGREMKVEKTRDN